MSLLAARDVRLPHGHRARSVHPPITLLDDEHANTRTTIVEVSDAAFGASTEQLWRNKFTAGFLGSLTRFYILTDTNDHIVGWSGYRARTINGERVIYFTSTGLLQICQGLGLIPALQRTVVASDARRHLLRAVTICVRTRNPHSYRLALVTFGNKPIVPTLHGSVAASRQRVVAAIGDWLGLDIDPDTAVVTDAYDLEGALYGQEPQTADQAVNALFENLHPRDALLVLGGRTRTNAFRLALSLRPPRHQR